MSVIFFLNRRNNESFCTRCKKIKSSDFLPNTNQLWYNKLCCINRNLKLSLQNIRLLILLILLILLCMNAFQWMFLLLYYTKFLSALILSHKRYSVQFHSLPSPNTSTRQVKHDMELREEWTKLIFFPRLLFFSIYFSRNVDYSGTLIV